MKKILAIVIMVMCMSINSVNALTKEEYLGRIDNWVFSKATNLSKNTQAFGMVNTNKNGDSIAITCSIDKTTNYFGIMYRTFAVPDNAYNLIIKTDQKKGRSFSALGTGSTVGTTQSQQVIDYINSAKRVIVIVEGDDIADNAAEFDNTGFQQAIGKLNNLCSPANSK